MKNLQSAATRNNTAATVAVEELRTMRTRIDSLNSQLNELENKNAALSVSISLFFSHYLITFFYDYDALCVLIFYYL
jgi:hypothetical protein